jgi:hypothetical protein
VIQTDSHGLIRIETAVVVAVNAEAVPQKASVKVGADKGYL